MEDDSDYGDYGDHDDYNYGDDSADNIEWKDKNNDGEKKYDWAREMYEDTDGNMHEWDLRNLDEETKSLMEDYDRLKKVNTRFGIICVAGSGAALVAITYMHEMDKIGFDFEGNTVGQNEWILAGFSAYYFWSMTSASHALSLKFNFMAWILKLMLMWSPYTGLAITTAHFHILMSDRETDPTLWITSTSLWLVSFYYYWTHKNDVMTFLYINQKIKRLEAFKEVLEGAGWDSGIANEYRTDEE